MWFDGAQLYRDIAENNPPLSFYLTATAVLMSRVIPIAPTQAFFGYCIVIGALSAA